MSVLARLVGAGMRLIPAARRTSRQIALHAEQWESHNTAVLSAGRLGALLVVLGDSAAQSVGADAYNRGYVGQTLDLLRARDGREWQVVNLSVSGARTRDLIDGQLPRLHAVVDQLGPADVVSAVVGGNDATHTPLEQWLHDVEHLFPLLPPGAVVATTPRGWHEAKCKPVNARIRELAAADGLRLADLWTHTGPPYRGRYADGFHPNELGYQSWTAAMKAALDL